MKFFGVVLGVVAAATCVPGSAGAQLIQLNVPRGFSTAKYATETSAWLYVGQPIGSTLLVLGTVQNPRTGYRELSVGVGVDVSGFGARVDTGVLVVEASEGVYTQFYLTPAYDWGSARVSGAINLYVPVGRSGTSQGYVDPLVVRTSLTDAINIGVNAVWRWPLNASARLGVGPALEVLVGGFDVTIELLRGVVRYPHETRLGVSFLF